MSKSKKSGDRDGNDPARKPIVSVLAPGGRRRFLVAPAMKPGERPLLFARENAFHMDVIDQETVEIINRTQYMAPFILLVVPNLLAGIAILPWRRIIDEFSKPGGPKRLGSALLTQLLKPTEEQ